MLVPSWDATTVCARNPYVATVRYQNITGTSLSGKGNVSEREARDRMTSLLKLDEPAFFLLFVQSIDSKEYGTGTALVHH